MKMASMSLIEWQRRFGTERSCAKALAKVRWPNGFQCPACGSKKFSTIASRQPFEQLGKVVREVLST